MAFQFPAVRAPRSQVFLARLHDMITRLAPRRGRTQAVSVEHLSDHMLRDIGLRRDEVRRDFGRHAFRIHLGI